MKSIKFRAASLFVIITCLVATQLGSVLGAYAEDAQPLADPPSDLAVTVSTVNDTSLFIITVCNNGPTAVINFTLDVDFTNYAADTLAISTFDTTAATQGTVDVATGEWDGVMNSGQCVTEAAFGEITGDIGEEITFSATITSSILADSSVNVDPTPGNDTSSIVPEIIVETPDLEIATRKLTSGAITTGSQVSYEVLIKNIGNVEYNITAPGDEPVLYFLMPAGATYVSFEDSDLADGLDINISGCMELGPVTGLGPQMSHYSGDLIVCEFDATGATLDAHSEFPFELIVEATSDFVSGTTQVLGVVLGSERDTMRFTVMQAAGADFLALPINNIVRLVLDESELIPTINPCSGQGAVVEVDEACFTISFNKEIYAPSFDEDDLILTGSGTISEFTQIGDNLWEIHVTGMTFGSTLTVSLAEGGILDLSAVANGTQVLGINTVRYGAEVDATDDGTAAAAAAGTLPETGTNADFSTAFALLILGFGIHFAAKRRHSALR